MDILEITDSNRPSINNLSELIKMIPTISYSVEYIDKCRNIKKCYKKVRFESGIVYNTNVGVAQGEHIQWLENNRIGFMHIFQRIMNRKSFKSDISNLVSKIFINRHKKPMSLSTIGGMENKECKRLQNLNEILASYFPEK